MAVDLDGTFVHGNTLKMYLKAGCQYLARTGRIWQLAKVAWWVAARRIKLIPHITMKLNAAAIIGWNEDVESRFRALVLPEINPAVQKLTATFKESGGKCVIASAAFGFYIPSICDLPFVATAIDYTEKECRGQEKCRRLNEWLTARGYKLHSVVTDHHDDIPLLKMPCEKRYLVQPSAETVKKVKATGIKDITYIR